MSKPKNALKYGFYMNQFTYEEMERIHNSTLHVLENVGLIVEGQEAMRLFADAGANVDFETCLVKLPPSLVEEAIVSVPSTINLAGRGNKGFSWGDGKVRFCSFGESPQIVDPYTKKNRNVTKQDEANYAKVVDALEEHDMCWDAWVATDIPNATYVLHSYDAYVNNTVKPACIATPNGTLAKAIVKMATAVAGSEQNLRENPVCIAGTCPKSPLSLDEGICESTIVLARAGIPIINMSALTSGGTGPVTLAGTLVVHNAEQLACFVLAQLAAEGAPCIYGSCTSALDLRRATGTYGCPELGMFSAAFAALCRYYCFPGVVAGFWTDSKIGDMQCGHEKTLTGLLPALSGADMIFGTGCLTAGLNGSLGQLVADNDMISMIRRVLKGIPIDEEELALEVIEDVGPKGNFLSEPHTIDNMSESQVYPELLDRNTNADWLNAGGKTLAQRADERVLQILENHKPEPLPAEVQEALTAIIAETERELGVN